MPDMSMSEGADTFTSDDSDINTSVVSELSLSNNSDDNSSSGSLCSDSRRTRFRCDFTLYYLLSRLPNKNLSCLDAVQGWLESPYGPLFDRVHLLCTLRVLNFDYASVTFIVWLALEAVDLESIQTILVIMPREASKARWYRNAVRFYSKHVVPNYTERTATTIDFPGTCVFNSIVISLPEFAMLQHCLSSTDSERTLQNFLSFKPSSYIHLHSSFRTIHEELFFDANEDWFRTLDEQTVYRISDSFYESWNHQVHLLLMDFTTLEARNRSGYTEQEIDDYLRSFDGDDDLIPPDGGGMEAYFTTIQEESTEIDIQSTVSLLIQLYRSLDPSPWEGIYPWIATELDTLDN